MTSLERIRAKYAYDTVASTASASVAATVAEQPQVRQGATSSPSVGASPVVIPTSLRGGTKERFTIQARPTGEPLIPDLPRPCNATAYERRLFNLVELDEAVRTAWGRYGRASARAYARFPFGVASVVLFVDNAGNSFGWCLEDTQALWESLEAARSN